jgi:ADP-ribosylglycohydrolase
MGQDKFLGCIYGLAIGDAMGFYTEFLSLKEILQKHGESGVKYFQSVEKTDGTFFPLGTYTDDTQMSLALARAILRTETLDVEDFMKEVKREFVNWMDSPDNNRAPGGACTRGCRNMKYGLHWKESGDPGSKGCGTAMRNAPLGLAYHNKLNKLVEFAHASSVCTHAHPTGIAAGIGTAYAVALITKGMAEPRDLVDMVARIPYANEEYRNKILQVNRVLNKKPDHAIPLLGEGWVGEEALAIALYCFVKYPTDFKKTIWTAVNTDGDSDSLACIAGALSGAYNGIEAIPSQWRREVENSELLGNIANKLYENSLKL